MTHIHGMQRIAHSTALLTPALAVRSKKYIISIKTRKRQMKTKGILGRSSKEEKPYIISDRLLKIPRGAIALLLNT